VTDARHQRAFDVFLTVCDLPNAEREHRLHALCADDPGLRADVERLLAHDDADEHFLQIGAAAEMIGARPATTGAESHPQRLGEYRILSLLGTGGMGVVYVAEQETPRRVVALKVLRPDAATPELLSRFAHETELLARLQHPSIAQIYEAGTADAGFGPQPFFAMEYVRGPCSNMPTRIGST
jgi:serine/threonine protein kinase